MSAHQTDGANPGSASLGGPRAESSEPVSTAETPQHGAEQDEAPIDAVERHVRRAGVQARPLRQVLALLTEGPHPLDELVRIPAVPRRTVEELLTAAEGDLIGEHGTHRISERARGHYRERFALDTLDPRSSQQTGPGRTHLLETIREFVETGPEPAAALDHVTAEPDTVLRRAEWLRENYDLRGARLLCLGDHDLTSLAVGLVEPSVHVTVIDLDERVLAHIDGIAGSRGLDVHTLHADLRFGVPPSCREGFDLVFTDPPYTPEGVGLFASRAVECLAGPASRLLLAYGYSSRSPALGRRVQQELLRMGMTFEAIVPKFNRYAGAQAIGSAAALYVCLPTPRTGKRTTRHGPAIYTHGPQSVESSPREPSEEFLTDLARLLRTEVPALHRPGWDGPLNTGKRTPVFDLRPDPGPWLLRMLLACNAETAAFVVPNRHPDITGEHAQQALSRLVEAKHRLRFHRSRPDATHAVVLAEPAETGTPAAAYLLHRAHGKLGNVWREALITASGNTLSKRQATEQVDALVTDPADLRARLVDLPRHRLSAMLHTESTAGEEPQQPSVSGGTRSGPRESRARNSAAGTGRESNQP